MAILNWKINMNNDNTIGSYGVFLLIISMFLLGWGMGILYALPRGFAEGVKAHADGRYAVVDMPDGTRQICEVKDKPVLLENTEILE